MNNCGREDNIKMDFKNSVLRCGVDSDGSRYCPVTDILNKVTDCFQEKSSTMELVTS
jgi:hypothetical protein